MRTDHEEQSVLGLLTTATKVVVLTRFTIRPAEVLAMDFTWIDVLAEDACYAGLVEWLCLIECHRTHPRNRDLLSCQLDQGLADPVASHELFLTRIAPVEVVAAVTRRGRGNVIPAAVQVWGDRGFVRMWWDRSQSAFPGQGTW
jgi:hypothetical protein